MRRYILLLLFFPGFLRIQAQEEEYYKVPENRKKSHEVENLPHLSSHFSTFYVGVTGGLRKAYNRSTGDFAGFAENNTSLNEWLELNLGLNMNNDFFVETGVVRLENQFTTHVFASPDWPAFFLGVRNRQWYVPVVLKKRVLHVNRVTKNAYINLGLGGGVLLTTRPEPPRGYSFDLPVQNPNLNYFNVTLSQSRSPIYGEFSTELKGNVTERLELLVFFKGIFRKPEYLSNTFDISLNGVSPQRYGVFERAGSLVFGLQARFNSRKFYRYTSRI